MTPTDVAQDVIDNALSVLDQGFDLSALAEMPGLKSMGEDEDGRMYFSIGSMPLMLDCDEEGIRIQWLGARAEACYEDFLAIFRSYDEDARLGVSVSGGHFEGNIKIGGRQIAYRLLDDVVPIGEEPGQTSAGTVLMLLDQDEEWSDTWHAGRHAHG